MSDATARLKIKAGDLPNGFYLRRRVVSDQLAACVLLDPKRCPSRSELPRKLISDEPLMLVLSCSILARDARQMAIEVAAAEGWEYVSELFGLLSNESKRSAFIWRSSWYAAQLRAMEELYQEYLLKIRELAAIYDRSLEPMLGATATPRKRA